jgi:GDP-L-fucose synthase
MMFDPDDILVTGGNGLVGSCVTGNHKPRSFEVDLMELDSLVDYINKNKIKYVVHCAGRVGGVKDNSENPGDFFYKNMQMSLNVLEASRITGVTKTLCMLSTCIFPADATYPLTIDQIHLGEPHVSNYGYGFSKRMLEVNARSYRDQYDMNVITIVPCNVYGPRDNFNLESSHVVPGLIHKAHNAKWSNQPLHVWGSGKPKRELLYSKDLGKITDKVLCDYDSPQPLIISPDEEISILDLAKVIAKQFGVEDIHFEEDMPVGLMRKPSDNSELKKFMDVDFLSIEEGIAETSDWFNCNYKDIRK